MEVNYRKASCALHLFITHSLECTHGFPYTWMYVVNTSCSFPHSWLIIGFVTRLTRRVLLVEQELLTHPEHLSSPPVLSGFRVTRSLVLCVCFADRCMSFCTFFFWPLFLFVLLRYADSGCLPLVSSNSSYRIYQKKFIKLPTFTKRIVCPFSQYYWGTLHNFLFFFQ
jgi:hypothetical protein